MVAFFKLEIDMLRSYKQWKQLNESLLATTLGISTPKGFLVTDQPLEEGKKKKKHMDLEDDEDVEEEEDEIDVEKDAETGDGEVVEPSSKKDLPTEEEPVEDEEEEDDDEEDERKLLSKAMVAPSPTMMKKKGMKKKMKKENQEWLASFNKMLSFQKTKNWDGFSEDALLPLTDMNGQELIEPSTPINTEPQPGEVGYSPETRLGM